MEWRPIPEYEGYYEISEFGDVRGIERIVIRKDGIKMFVKPTAHTYVQKGNILSRGKKEGWQFIYDK